VRVAGEHVREFRRGAGLEERVSRDVVPPTVEDPGPSRVASASGVPRSMIASPALAAQAIQASMPACIVQGG
jgi:hypothetical protein